MLSPAGDDDKSAVDEAGAFLDDLLADGPVPSREVQRQADEAGISRSTLRRAKTARGVVVRKQGGRFGDEKQRWEWTHPAAEALTETNNNAEGANESQKMPNSETWSYSAKDEHLLHDDPPTLTFIDSEHRPEEGS